MPRRQGLAIPILRGLAVLLALGGGPAAAARASRDAPDVPAADGADFDAAFDEDLLLDDSETDDGGDDGAVESLPPLRGGTAPYRVGERFRYSIYWGPLHVGRSIVEVKEIKEVNGHPCYRIVARTRSNAVISAVYPVDDTVESYVDVEGLFSRRFIKKLNEGRYHCDEETLFDVENGVAYWQSHRDGRTKEYAIPEAPQDPLSLVYFLRGHKLDPRSRYKATVCADEKVYEMLIESRGKTTLRMSRGAGGRRRAIEVEPKAKFKGIFVRKGRMWVWVSDDDQRLLLRMVTKIPVASVRMILAEAKNVGPGAKR